MIDPRDRQLVLATQAGLPLDVRPFHRVAEATGLSVAEVLARFRAMRARGAVRRIAAVPHHVRLGLRANGMSVWDVDDARVDELGARVGALDFVSHCYRRPRRPPVWPYNLFAMVHGRSVTEVEEKVAVIAGLMGEACRGHDVLYSVRVLKKTGIRLAAGEDPSCSD